MFANSHIKQIRKVKRRLKELEVALTALSDSGTGTDLEFVPVPDPVNTLMTGINDSTGWIENAIERGRNVDPRHVEALWNTLRTLEYVVGGEQDSRSAFLVLATAFLDKRPASNRWTRSRLR